MFHDKCLLFKAEHFSRSQNSSKIDLITAQKSRFSPLFIYPASSPISYRRSPNELQTTTSSTSLVSLPVSPKNQVFLRRLTLRSPPNVVQCAHSQFLRFYRKMCIWKKNKNYLLHFVFIMKKTNRERGEK